MISAFNVDRVSQTRLDPVLRGRVEAMLGRFYGGVRARSAARVPADMDLFLGLRPVLVGADCDFAPEPGRGGRRGGVAEH